VEESVFSPRFKVYPLMNPLFPPFYSPERCLSSSLEEVSLFERTLLFEHIVVIAYTCAILLPFVFSYLFSFDSLAESRGSPGVCGGHFDLDSTVSGLFLEFFSVSTL